MLGGSIGQYRITGIIGQGGMGIVYGAEHALLGRPAAVKVLLPELSQNQQIVTRFFNEARAATAIRHPGIVEIFDFGWHADGSAYIVMELLDGMPLTRRMEHGPLSGHGVLAIARQIAGALAAAHAKGIVHRDLKPDNVFLVPDPEVPGGERIKLLDFGIAKLANDHHGNSSVTRTGSVMGTPTYMAPEQCRGVAVDHRADLYALGCILFQMYTCRPPFSGEGSGDVLAAHIYVPPPPLATLVPGAPQELEALLARLLAKSPEQRFQSAGELIAAIDTISGGALRTSPGIAEVPVPPIVQTTLSGAAGERATRRPPRSRALVIGGLASTVIALGVAGILWTANNDEPARARVAATSPAVSMAPVPAGAPAPPGAPAAQDPTPPPAPVVAPAPPAPAPVPNPDRAPPAMVPLVVASSPAGADLWAGGVRLGKTPYRGSLPRGDADVRLTLRLVNHKTKDIVVRPTAAIEQMVKLDPRPKDKPRPDRDQSVNPFGK